MKDCSWNLEEEEKLIFFVLERSFNKALNSSAGIE
jgi:hypothetical protein